MATNKRIEDLEHAVKPKRTGSMLAVHGLHGPYWSVGGERVTEKQIDKMAETLNVNEVIKFRIIRGADNTKE